LKNTHKSSKERDAAAVGSLLVVTIGGIVEIAPLFYLRTRSRR
jgi:cbb3-type cytochrome oxidase cytochrome c subunit